MRTVTLFLIVFFASCVLISTGRNINHKIEIKAEQPTQIVDTINDVSGKWATFIGDSHTANNYWGWQILLCDKTDMKMNNLSVGGKTTDWMLKIAKNSIHSKIDYCFIYGGANDMYGSVKARVAVKNVQEIVNICNSNNVKAFVITGFNPYDCVVTPDNPGYPKRYADFQQMLIDSIKGAKVIDTRSAVIKKDCGDNICHMNYSGHKKMAETVIAKLKLKIKNPR